jgi:hypothetical protein
MKKLFKIKNTLDSDWLYVGAKNLVELVEAYPNALVIEHVSDRLSVNSGDRYNLLVKAYKFIDNGANTYTLTERHELLDEIKSHLA